MTPAEAGQLLARYFEGELSLSEQRQLTDAILADQDLFNAFAEEHLFMKLLDDAGFRAKVNSAVRPERTSWARPFLGISHAAWQWSGAAGMLALVLLVAVFLYRGGKHSSEIARPHSPPPAVLTVLLTPTERGSPSPRIILGNYITVRFEIPVPQTSFVAYRVVLAAVDRGFERGFTDLMPRRTSGAAPQLEFEIPAAQMPAGDYRLELSGLTSTGSTEPAAGYAFSVVQK